MSKQQLACVDPIGYGYLNHKAWNSTGLKIVHLFASSTFIAPYFHYSFLKDAPFRPYFCFVHTIAQFSRILRFSHIYCQIFRIVPFVDGSRYEINGPLRPLNSECITSEKFQIFLRILFWRNILKSWPREKETTSPHIYQFFSSPVNGNYKLN